MKKKFWHIGLCALLAAGIFAIVDFIYLRTLGELPGLKEIWWLVLLVPLLCGAVVTIGCGGATLGERVIGAAACGICLGVLYTALSLSLPVNGAISFGNITINLTWRIFVFAIFSTIGAVITELKWPDPEQG